MQNEGWSECIASRRSFSRFCLIMASSFWSQRGYSQFLSHLLALSPTFLMFPHTCNLEKGKNIKSLNSTNLLRAFFMWAAGKAQNDRNQNRRSEVGCKRCVFLPYSLSTNNSDCFAAVSLFFVLTWERLQGRCWDVCQGQGDKWTLGRRFPTAVRARCSGRELCGRKSRRGGLGSVSRTRWHPPPPHHLHQSSAPDGVQFVFQILLLFVRSRPCVRLAARWLPSRSCRASGWKSPGPRRRASERTCAGSRVCVCVCWAWPAVCVFRCRLFWWRYLSICRVCVRFSSGSSQPGMWLCVWPA